MDTVEKYIYRLPDGVFEFAERVRLLILAAHPEVTEKLSFGLPFFNCRQWLCYFHFADDILLEVGFCKGNQLSNQHGVLIAKDRKQIRSLIYTIAEDFNEQIFLDTLNEAIEINLLRKKKTPKVSAL